MTPPAASTVPASGASATTTLPAARVSVQAGPVDPVFWQTVCDTDPTSLPEQSPAWITAVCASGSFEDASRSYVAEDGRRFVLPLVRRRGPRGVGGQLWSMPEAWGIGGLVGTGLDRYVVDEVVDDLRSLRVARASIRIDPLDEPHWGHLAEDPRVLRIPRRAHVLAVHDDEDRQLAELGRTCRNRLHRSTRNGVTVEVVPGPAAIAQHRALFECSLRRWSGRTGEPEWLAARRAQWRDPVERLYAMAAHLGDRFAVVVGRVDGVPAASAVVLLGPTTRYTRGATDAAVAGTTGVTVAVQWAAIGLARRFGSTTYNMGESGDAVGLSRFKESLGAVAVPYAEYRIERLPFTRADALARRAVKRIVGFSG